MRIWVIPALVFNLSLWATAATTGESAPDAGYARVHSGKGGSTLNTGGNVIDKATLPCVSSTGKCKFGISAMVIISSTGSTNPWSICATVDGQAANPPCAAQQDAPTDHPVTGMSLQVLKVPTIGNHHVKLQVHVSGPARLGGWSVVYQAYPNG